MVRSAAMQRDFRVRSLPSGSPRDLQRSARDRLPLACGLQGFCVSVTLVLVACATRLNSASRNDTHASEQGGSLNTAKSAEFAAASRQRLSSAASADEPVVLSARRKNAGDADAKAKALAPIASGALCVTRGELAPNPTGSLSIEHPSFRAVAPRTQGDDAELRFTYLGATEQTSRLASGSARRQIGLKLRAEDGCNLVYAMLRLDPQPQVVVSVKRNRGKTTHAECGAAGYMVAKPIRKAILEPLTPQSPHVMRATIRDSVLQVTLDAQPVWEGRLSEEALDLRGPIGLRSDNARLVFSLLGDAPTHTDSEISGPSGCGEAIAGDE